MKKIKAMSKKLNEINEVLKIKHLTWSMDNHPTAHESDERLKQVIKETITSWEDDSYWLTPLNPNQTGLPVTILVDEGAYIRDMDHPLYLYFRNTYDSKYDEFLPIVVSNSPQVVLNGQKLGIYKRDLQKVLLFVAKNYKRIIDVAYDRMSIKELINGRSGISESKEILTEMSILNPNQTGLPFNIWVGVNKKQHFLGIKFPPQQGIKNSNDFAECAVPGGKVYSSVAVEPWRERIVKKFIEANKDSFIELGKDFALYTFISDNLVKVDEKGNPIEDNEEAEYIPCTKNPINGFMRVRNKDSKYNFIRENGSKVISPIWFDDANDFNTYSNGLTAAFVMINNTPKWLLPNGELKDM